MKRSLFLSLLLVSTISYTASNPADECIQKAGDWVWDKHNNQWFCDSHEVIKITEPNRIEPSGYPLLIEASIAGNIKQMKQLIENGAQINYQHADGNYPLYKFIVDGYTKNSPKESLEMVKWMIEKGADYSKKGFNNYTLIHASEDLDLTQYLVELGMDIKSLTDNNASTLMGSIASDLSGKVENSSLQNYLIEHCVDPKQVAYFDGKAFSAADIATTYKRYQAQSLLNNAIKNPPAQCKNGGLLPPKISFYNLSQTYDTEQVNISIEVEAQGSGIGDIALFLNGTEIEGKQDRALKIKRDGMKVRTFSVKLQNGLNELRAYAYDTSNKVKSEEIVHEVVSEYRVNTKPKLYVVAIGVDEFANKDFNLKYAEADASLFGSMIYKRSKELFSEVHIDYLKKQEGTTKEAILSKLASLQDISANDFFIFFSATHGVDIGGKYYMITSNVKNSEEATIHAKALSEDDLRSAFRKIPTANKLLLFDTCYSGSINENISKELAKKSVGKLNLTSISAANSKQTALEGFADGHGIFTYVLTDALEGDADLNHDGLIQSMELVNYVNRMVPIEARKYNHVQTPAFFQSGQVFTITKTKESKGPVDLKPQYYKPQEVQQLVSYMENNDAKGMNHVIETKKSQTVKTVEKIIHESTKVESKNAIETFQQADKKFQFGQFNFIFNDNAIFLDIKDKIKDHHAFTDPKGRHLVYFDFYTKDKAPRVIRNLDTEKVSDIYMYDYGGWYRVTLQTKSEQLYSHVISDDGVYIKLKNN